MKWSFVKNAKINPIPHNLEVWMGRIMHAVTALKQIPDLLQRLEEIETSPAESHQGRLICSGILYHTVIHQMLLENFTRRKRHHHPALLLPPVTGIPEYTTTSKEGGSIHLLYKHLILGCEPNIGYIRGKLKKTTVYSLPEKSLVTSHIKNIRK